VKDNLNIEKLFKDKFDSFEPAVNSKVWQGIAAGVGSAGTTAASGITWFKGLLIGAVATTAGIGAWLYFDDTNTAANSDQTSEKIENVSNSLQTDLANVEPSKAEISTPENTVVSVSSAQNSTLSPEGIDSDTDETAQKEVSKPDMADPIVNDVSFDTRGVDSKSAIVSNDAAADAVDQNSTNPSAVSSDAKPVKVTSFEEATNSDDNVANKTNQINDVANDTVDAEFLQEDHANVPVENKSFLKDIPNVFTPSNDGANDMFFIPKENMQNIDKFYIVIFSKYNIKLFESEDPEFKWDGYDFGDNKVPKEACYYLIKAVGLDGQTYSIKGQINIF